MKLLVLVAENLVFIAPVSACVVQEQAMCYVRASVLEGKLGTRADMFSVEISLWE